MPPQSTPILPPNTNNRNERTNASSRSIPTNANLEQELDHWRRKQELLELKRQVRELENADLSLRSGVRKVDFCDIEHALPKFKGEGGTLSIRNFIIDFEEIMKSVEADASFKLICPRRCLEGTAKLFLQTTTALNYEELKASLLEEFTCVVGKHDIYKRLAERRWDRRNETLHFYILTMQALAKRGQVEEKELIDFILEGIDNQLTNMHILMGARTIAELKSLVNRYQERYLLPVPGAKRPNTTTAVTKPATSVRRETPVKDLPLCYNCSQRGHIKPNCPYPLRPNASCFRCWKTGHDHRSYPNPKKVMKPLPNTTVNAVDAEEIVGLDNLDLSG